MDRLPVMYESDNYKRGYVDGRAERAIYHDDTWTPIGGVSWYECGWNDGYNGK